MRNNDYNAYNMNNNENSEVNGMNNNYNGFSTDSIPSKAPKKNTAARIAASLMAMVLVSAGSVGIYRQVTGTDVNTAATVSSEAAENTSSNAVAKNMSMIAAENSGTADLSNEDVVEKMLPSVVGIESTFTMTSSANAGNYFSFGGFGYGQEQQPRTSEAAGTGTGVVITEDGYIVTNAHVIYDSEYGAGLADSISVILNDDNTYEAEVIGYDTDYDLAVLRIQATGLAAAEFGNSDELKLGQSVIAIGNPLGFDLMDTVTSGIVSGLNRQMDINSKSMTLIQTDAAINSGNSGGPLINKYGQVVGINSSKMSASYSETSIEGIGFAIPSNEAARIVGDIMEYGYVTGKPQLGISCQTVTEDISRMYNLPVGVYITAVEENSAADKAGLLAGDIITGVDGETVTTFEELTAKKNEHKAGESMEVTFTRNGEDMTVSVTLDEAVNTED